MESIIKTALGRAAAWRTSYGWQVCAAAVIVGVLAAVVSLAALLSETRADTTPHGRSSRISLFTSSTLMISANTQVHDWLRFQTFGWDTEYFVQPRLRFS